MEPNQTARALTGKSSYQGLLCNCQRSYSSQDPNRGSKGAFWQAGQFQFQFIDVGTQSKGQQNRNRLLARSHVTKVVRRAKQKKQEDSKIQEAKVQESVRSSYQRATDIQCGLDRSDLN
jgi:hypothetical protein